MYAPGPETMWNLIISEAFTVTTLFYLIGAVAFFAVIILVLEFLDSTRGKR